MKGAQETQDWKAEEFEAHKKLSKELEISFEDERLKDHEKVRELFKVSK